VAVSVPVLWLCGPTAVGKSTVAWEIFIRVRGERAPAAYVDLAQVGFGPTSPGDPQCHRLKAANLAAMWSTFRDAGAQRLILSGAVSDPGVVRLYDQAVPGSGLTLCRLRASRDALIERVLLKGRGAGPLRYSDKLNGRPHAALLAAAEAAFREGETLESFGTGDFCVDTDGLDPAEVATTVLRSARWG
jgi:hypothetical protein